MGREPPPWLSTFGRFFFSGCPPLEFSSLVGFMGKGKVVYYTDMFRINLRGFRLCGRYFFTVLPYYT